MAPEDPEHGNVYAPPGSEPPLPPVSPAEPWTLGSCIAASARTSIHSPVLAWVGLGVIPNLTATLEFLESGDATREFAILVVGVVVQAVLTGGHFRIANQLIRQEPASLQVYLPYARLAPDFVVLTLPLLMLVVLMHGSGEAENPSNVEMVIMLTLIPATVGAAYLMYRLSLAWCARVDANVTFGQALAHSWRRTGASARKFLVLFMVTSIPFVLSLALEPMASTVLSVATLPLTTLCWAHAYNAGLAMNGAAIQPRS